MQYYITHIEKHTEKSIHLYGRQITTNTQTIIHLPILPTYLTFSPTTNSTKRRFLINYFYSHLPLNTIAHEFNYDPKILDTIKEFSSPVEQFIIQSKMKGPTLIEILKCKENSDKILVEKIEHLKILEEQVEIELKIFTFLDEDQNNNLKNNTTGNNHAYNSNNNIYSYRIDSVKINSKQQYTLLTQGKTTDLNKTATENKCDFFVYFNKNNEFIKSLGLKGIITVDVYARAMKALRCRDYSLDEIYDKVCVDMDNDVDLANSLEDISLSNNNNQLLTKLHNIFKSMSILELSKEISTLCGCLWSKSIVDSRVDCNDFLLMHEFYHRGILFPPKCKEESTYKGGLVLEPQIGFYNTYVVLLDFKSLYPSIVREYGICFSNDQKAKKDFECVEGDNEDKNLKNKNIIKKEVDKIFNDHKSDTGILPEILRSLIQRRTKIKDLLKTAQNQHQKNNYNTRQLAIKLTANSIYGCLGTSHSKFCNFKMAAEITEMGRRILTDTKKMAEEMELKVIYGDTDSIMIDTCVYSNIKNEDTNINNNYTNAMGIINKLRESVNKKYNCIELELENIFIRVLLLGKKKYGVLKNDGKLDSKGFDYLRRDFCALSCEMSYDIFKFLMLYSMDNRNFLNAKNTVSNNNKNLTNIEKKNNNDFGLSNAKNTVYNNDKNLNNIEKKLNNNEKNILNAKNTMPNKYENPSYIKHLYHPFRA